MTIYENGKVGWEMNGLSSPHHVELTPDLNVRKELCGVPYNFHSPRYWDVMPDGTLIVAEKNTDNLKIIGQDDTLLQVNGMNFAGKGPGRFMTAKCL